MSQIVRTQDGDVLDLMCFQHYGKEGMTEQVLEANLFLVEYSTHLPQGLEIEMPDVEVSELVEQVDEVRLWD